MDLVVYVDFACKVIASLASVAPLYLTWEALSSSDALTDRQKRLLSTPALLAPLAFGTAYASCGDARAIAAAAVVAWMMLDLWQGLS